MVGKHPSFKIKDSGKCKRSSLPEGILSIQFNTSRKFSATFLSRRTSRIACMYLTKYRFCFCKMTPPTDMVEQFLLFLFAILIKFAFTIDWSPCNQDKFRHLVQQFTFDHTTWRYLPARLQPYSVDWTFIVMVFCMTRWILLEICLPPNTERIGALNFAAAVGPSNWDRFSRFLVQTSNAPETWFTFSWFWNACESCMTPDIRS